MPTDIKITIPDGVANRPINSLAAAFGYTGFLADGITPITKKDFIRNKTMEFWKAAISNYEVTQQDQINKVSLDNIKTDINNNINFT